MFSVVVKSISLIKITSHYKIKNMSMIFCKTKNPHPQDCYVLGTRVISSWCHPSLSTCCHIDLFRYGIFKCLYPSSVTGAPVIAFSKENRYEAQRLVSINISYSFSAAGALCKETNLFTLLFIANY
jgi:hypothetical protein